MCESVWVCVCWRGFGGGATDYAGRLLFCNTCSSCKGNQSAYACMMTWLRQLGGAALGWWQYVIFPSAFSHCNQLSNLYAKWQRTCGLFRVARGAEMRAEEKCREETQFKSDKRRPWRRLGKRKREREKEQREIRSKNLNAALRRWRGGQRPLDEGTS